MDSKTFYVDPPFNPYNPMQALAQCPTHVDGLVARGALLANGGHLKRAAADLERALALDQDAANARSYLESVRVRLGYGPGGGVASGGTDSSRLQRPPAVMPTSTIPSNPIAPVSASAPRVDGREDNREKTRGQQEVGRALDDAVTGEQLRDLLRGDRSERDGNDDRERKERKRRHKEEKKLRKEQKKSKKREKDSKKESKKSKKQRKDPKTTSEAGDASSSSSSEDPDDGNHPILSRTRHKYWG